MAFIRALSSETGSKEGAAKDVRSGVVGRCPIQQRDKRAPAGIVSGVRARASDAAAEDQRAGRVVEQRLAGGRRTESARLASIVVADDCRVGKRGGSPPKIGLLPPLGKPNRSKKQDVGSRPAAGASERLRQLPQAGPSG